MHHSWIKRFLLKLTMHSSKPPATNVDLNLWIIALYTDCITGWSERSQGRRKICGVAWSWSGKGCCTISTWSQWVWKHSL